MTRWGNIFGCVLVAALSVTGCDTILEETSAFGVGSVQFVSEDEGWVLGRPAGCTGQCIEIRHTTDGGRSWRRAPALPFPPSGLVFADSRNWFATYRPPTPGAVLSELWSTHDGGEHWQRVLLPGVRLWEYLPEVVVADGTVQVPFFDPYSGEMFVVTGPVGTDDFTRSEPLRVPVDADEYRSRSHEFGMVRAGTTTWFGGGLDSPTRRAAPGREARLIDGRWSSWALPCPERHRPKLFAPNISALLISCIPRAEDDIAFGTHHLFVSTDAGDTFTHRGVLPAALTAAATTEDLVVAITDPSDDTRTALRTSHDGGRTWTTTLAPPATRGLHGNPHVTHGAFFTPRVGFVVLPYIGTAPDGEERLYLTRDGGDTWNLLVLD
ncbi:hypothetical protein AB0H76_18460 [Nocardia sp. NPDC050712]|uniref:hypothetical protein n=1 Tax=Nocardia sp. NPDC050712 TaxID=3155518 RepID=UPI0033E9011A